VAGGDGATDADADAASLGDGDGTDVAGGSSPLDPTGDADGTRAEVAWSALHGLATLQAGGRLRASHVQARLDLVHDMLTQPGAQ